jgi:hypothetical protein
MINPFYRANRVENCIFLMNKRINLMGQRTILVGQRIILVGQRTEGVEISPIWWNNVPIW